MRPGTEEMNDVNQYYNSAVDHMRGKASTVFGAHGKSISTYAGILKKPREEMCCTITTCVQHNNPSLSVKNPMLQLVSGVIFLHLTPG